MVELSFFWPVAGNLFHHAVEMFLKFLLLKTYSEEELRDSFRHNLRRLWKEYKRVNSGDHLGKYDQLVSTINRMEDLRYPRSGYVFSIDLQAGPVHDASGQVAKRTQHYHLNLEDLDEFISTLLVGRVTSGWFRALLSHGDAQVQYEQHNVHRFY